MGEVYCGSLTATMQMDDENTMSASVAPPAEWFWRGMCSRDMGWLSRVRVQGLKLSHILAFYGRQESFPPNGISVHSRLSSDLS